MKSVKICVTETKEEIKIDVDGKTNSRIRFIGQPDKDQARKNTKLAVFDLVYHYANTALDSRIDLSWFNNF